LDIRRIEDLRIEDSRELREALLHSESPVLRSRAALAMGRIGSQDYLPALERALLDDDPAAHAQAAFAIGLILEPSTRPARAGLLSALLEGVSSPSSAVRENCLEALGRSGGPGVEPFLEPLLSSHQEPALRREAALALFRLRYGGRIQGYSTSTVRALTDGLRMEGPSRWAFAYAFSRWPEPEAAGSLAEAISAEDPRARIFALRGLAQLGARAPAEVAEEAFKDADARVRVEALGLLAACGTPERMSPAAFTDDSAQVRAAAAVLTASPGGAESSLRRFLLDPAPVVRAEAYAGLAKRLRERALTDMRRSLTDPSWWVRSRAAESASALARSGPGLLEAFLKDADVRVRTAALKSFAQEWPRKARPSVEAALRDSSSSLESRGTAVEIAAESKDESFFDALAQAYRNSFTRDSVEVRESIVSALEAFPRKNRSADIVRLLSSMLEDPAPSVRAKAARALGRPVPAAAPGEVSPFLDESVPSGTRAALRTSKGEFIVELDVEQAPIHCASLVSLIGKKAYDGLEWHRAAQNFVVQGGDPRGTGWGDAGYSLRDEVSPLRFSRGALGMPKSGKDTGGSQLFITTVDAPHLDGRYTRFGRVVSGMDAVDRLEPGDRIFNVVLLPPDK
jgi:cyclophilin family peptidyl-prolyl cis-trans isomerase/HEAT repeat protein